MRARQHVSDVYLSDDRGLYTVSGIKVNWNMFISSARNVGAMVIANLRESMFTISMRISEDSDTGLTNLNITYNLNIWNWVEYKQAHSRAHLKEHTNCHMAMMLLPNNNYVNASLIDKIKDTMDTCIERVHKSNSTDDVYRIVQGSIDITQRTLGGNE